MKINIIIPFTNITGGIKVIFEYANRLMEKGYDIEIYSPIIPYSVYYPRIIRKGIMAKEICLNIINKDKVDWFDLKVKLNHIPYINEKYIRDADIIIATAWPTAKSINKFNKEKGRKMYFIQDYEIWHGHVEEVKETYKFPMKKIVISKWLKDLLENEFNTSKCELIYNGIDFHEMFTRDKRFDKEVTTVVMLYHKLKSKGFEDGISIINNIKKRGKNINLVVFGAKKGKDIPKYAKFYHKPSRSELRKIYSEGDVFLFTSKKEGWGLTPLEAMACKCAVVGTNVGAINEIGKDGHNVLTVSPNNINELEKKLEMIIDDNSLRKKIALNGYETVKSLRWEESVDKFEKYINEVIKN